YRSGAAGAARAGEAQPGPGLFSPLALGGTCQKHPSRLVQLYCRMCRQAGCGQCISEEHQGIFHSVNLIDTVYQEEKLTFFGSLKKMRKLNEKLMNEISSQPNDMDMVLNNDAEIIALEFGEIFKTLEMKKRQLLEDVENQRSKKEKEFQIWKKMKEAHKKTIENFLKDCEKLVHECDPQRFLEVACGLNTRMKTQLDLMNIASSYEKPSEYTQKKMDIKPVVNEILALKLMPVNVGIAKDLPSGGIENSTKNPLFKNNIKQWQDQKSTPNTFLPVLRQEEAQADGSRICTRLMSISEMAAFQNMSHEEIRYKYYMEHQKLTDEFKTQTLPANKKHKFVTAAALKGRSSGSPSVSSPIKANKTDNETLRRADGFGVRSFSGTSDYSIPSETNGDLKLFHERGSQDVTTPALSENSKDFVIKEKLPTQPSAVIVSNDMDTNSSTSSSLKPATVSNSEFLDVSAERLSASPFAFSACNNSLPRFIKDAGTFSFKNKDGKYVFPQFYLGKCDSAGKTDNQDEIKFRKHGHVTKTRVSDASTSSNLDSAESEKPDFSFPFGNSEKLFCNSFKVLQLSSFFSQSDKPSDKNTSHMREKTLSAKETAEYGTQKPSAAGEQKADASESITNVPCSTSETSTAAGVNDVSETPLFPSNCAFSFQNNCVQLSSPVFSFGSIVRNTSDSLNSSMFFCGNGTEKVRSPDKTPLSLGKPVSSECAEPASGHSHPKCEGSFFPGNSSKKPESAEMLADSNASCSQPLYSVVLPGKYENASSTQLTVTATNQEAKIKDEESETVVENSSCCPRGEDECESVQFQNAACSLPGTCKDPSLGGSVLTVNETGRMPSDGDSDTEELSQTSVSTDASSASEYFSVAEDKLSTRRKSET
ncbi:putative LOC102090490, partial [Columba livia]